MEGQLGQSSGGARPGSDTPARCSHCARLLKFVYYPGNYETVELSKVELPSGCPIICNHCSAVNILRATSDGNFVNRARLMTPEDLAGVSDEMISRIARIQQVIRNYRAMQN